MLNTGLRPKRTDTSYAVDAPCSQLLSIKLTQYQKALLESICAQQEVHETMCDDLSSVNT